MRVLKVEEGGHVSCQEGVPRNLENCRFCVHSRRFYETDRWVASPARAYCMCSRSTDGVDLAQVTAVECDDEGGEGFRSMMSIIS